MLQSSKVMRIAGLIVLLLKVLKVTKIGKLFYEEYQRHNCTNTIAVNVCTVELQRLKR